MPHSSNNGNENVTVADSGRIEMSDNKKNLTFTLFNGTNYVEKNNVSYSDTSLTLQKVTFDMQKIIIPLENYAFEKSSDNKYGNQVMAKNLSQLSRDKDSLYAEYKGMLRIKTGGVVNSVHFMHCDGLDSTLNKAYPKRIASDSLLRWEDLTMEQSAYRRAADISEELNASKELLKQQKQDYAALQASLDKSLTNAGDNNDKKYKDCAKQNEGPAEIVNYC